MQALFYKPSFDNLQERIKKAFPGLEVILFDEEGKLTLNGKPIDSKSVSPQIFWVHSELFFSKHLKTYFDLVRQAPENSWLHTVNTGLDLGPYFELLQSGLTITNNHSQAISISEYVFGQLLSYYQGVRQLTEQQREGKWRYRRFQELKGSSWLIIGFGEIGKAIAHRAKAFDVNITAARRKQETEGLADQVCSLENLPEHLSIADVVILACASNDNTRALVNADFLATMKENAVLINIGRGDLVVEEDLCKGLDIGRPKFAILDVFNKEPPDEDSWVWQHSQVSLTPHCSNGGSGMKQRSEDLFIENLRRFNKQESLLNEVGERNIR